MPGKKPGKMTLPPQKSFSVTPLVPKRHFNQILWNIIPLQHQDQTNSGALHVQDVHT